MNILDHIKEEHEEARKIIKKLEEAKGEEKSSTLEELYIEVFSHVKSEEEVLFPKVKSVSEDGKDVVMALIEEHTNANHELNLLRRISVEDEQFDSKVGLLKELLDHHMEEEEEDLFNLARNIFSNEELEMMLDDFEKAKQRLEKDLKEGLVMENKKN